MPEEEVKTEDVEGEEEEEPAGPKLRHDVVEPLDPVGTPNRRWSCRVCGLEGTIDALTQKSCTRTLTVDERAKLALTLTIAREHNPEWEGDSHGPQGGEPS